MFGAGFWTPFQLAGWREVGGVRPAAIYNRTRPRAEEIAHAHGIPAVYADPDRMLREVRPDFVDNITEIGGHVPLSSLAARHRIPTICQKPLAPTLADATALVDRFRRAGTPLLVHENWRWQSTMQALRRLLARGAIGTPLRARLSMVSGFDVFANQPALARLDRFILMDLGTHLLDVARVLFGEARTLACATSRTLEGIDGENVATVLLTMGQARTHVTVELGYARTPLEPSAREVFPQTLAFVEGTTGSVELSADYLVRVTTSRGTAVSRHPPARYGWADPRYDIAHASIADCCADLLKGLRGTGGGETSGEDNLKTLRLVFAAYRSAAAARTITFPS